MAILWQERGRHRRFRLPENQALGAAFPGVTFGEPDIGGLDLVLHDIEGAELRWWPNGVSILDAGGNLVAELCARSTPPPDDLDAQPLHRVDATLASIIQWPARRNYCHMLCEGLPVIEGLSRAGVLGDVDALIVDDYRAAFVREALALYGAAPELLETGDMGRLKCRRLLMFEPLRHVAHWLHDATEAFFAKVSASTGPRAPPDLDMVISRPRGWRSIANQDALLARLPGFKAVRLEKIATLKEQAALFARARTIIAPHGAGLSNIVFCQPGAKVLEVFNQAYGTSTFYSLAQLTGVRYLALMDERGQQAYDTARKFEEMRVDVDEVVGLVGAAATRRRGWLPWRRP